jgi:hypothetical protein
MERRNFLLSLCGIGGVALAAGVAGAASVRRVKIVNATNRSIFLKIVSPFPNVESSPPRGGMLFPEEHYFDDLSDGKRVLIVWDAMSRTTLLMKELDVVAACRIDVHEGDAVVTHEV